MVMYRVLTKAAHLLPPLTEATTDPEPELAPEPDPEPVAESEPELELPVRKI